jgi:hypothetical protein
MPRPRLCRAGLAGQRRKWAECERGRHNPKTSGRASSHPLDSDQLNSCRRALG